MKSFISFRYALKTVLGMVDYFFYSFSPPVIPLQLHSYPSPFYAANILQTKYEPCKYSTINIISLFLNPSPLAELGGPKRQLQREPER